MNPVGKAADMYRFLIIYCTILLLRLPLPFRTLENVQGSCIQEKFVEEVAVTVVSEAANLFFAGDARITGCRPSDCSDVQQRGKNLSGVYRIWPRNSDLCGFDVYCDLEKDGGGWTVIQRRGNFGREPDFFNKLWRDYKFGFGNISEDFWLGNERIREITNQDNYVLRIDLRANEDWNHAQYDNFFIEPENQQYTLRFSGYSGNAGDSLLVHSDMKFTTRDKDNDKSARTNCAKEWDGGWWYKSCHFVNLNGLYLNGQHDKPSAGIMWKSWKGDRFSYQDTVMKIRPKSFSPIQSKTR